MLGNWLGEIQKEVPSGFSAKEFLFIMLFGFFLMATGHLTEMSGLIILMETA